MTFTYTDPSSSLMEAVRFYSQDVLPDDAFLTDEEISFVIAEWSNITDNAIYLAAACCDTISAKFARELSYSADGVSVGANELQEKYSRLAESLREQYKSIDVGDGPDVGGIINGETFDPDIKSLSWSKGMHDNIEAGKQDFGGHDEHVFGVYQDEYHF